MYIPFWIIVIVVIIYLIYRSKRKPVANIQDAPSEGLNDIDDIEERVAFWKENIFELEHFDSPHFIDLQNAYDVMEANYFRIKQRLVHNPTKVVEIAKDWLSYVISLKQLKFARVMLDVDWSDEAFDNAEERSKEASIIKDEIEKKFQSLLEKDWQQIPPDYHTRMETYKKPPKRKGEAMDLLSDNWEFYYRDSQNLYKVRQKRAKANEEREKEKAEESTESTDDVIDLDKVFEDSNK